MGVQSNAPVIIKRKKVIGGDGHHGGAWKVAYADFVTAMMAFFMLMWLLNATTEKQRKGIADYFNPTIPINRISGGGEGSFGGESIFSEQVLAQSGTGATNKHATPQRQARGQSGVDAVADRNDAIKRALSLVEGQILSGGGESLASPHALRHIVTRVTDEGLIVEVRDLEDSPLFLPDTGEPAPVLKEIAAMIAEVFALVTNDVAIGGHTSAHPVVLAQDPGWRLSQQRATHMRTLLEAAGLAPLRVRRVTAHSDRDPSARDPMAPANNRLEITLLRSDL